MAGQLCLARRAARCDCDPDDDDVELPLLLLLPGTPPTLRALLTRPALFPLWLKRSGLYLATSQLLLLPSPTASSSAAAGRASQSPSEQQGAAAALPRLLSQLRSLELVDTQPAGGLAALACLTQLTRLHLSVERATHSCGYEYSYKCRGSLSALTALVGLAALAVDGLYKEHGLRKLQGLTELRVQQSLDFLDMGDDWGWGEFGRSLCRLTCLQRLTVQAEDMQWDKDDEGCTLTLLRGALRKLPKLQQFVVEGWDNQLESWHGLCAQFIRPVLAHAPSLQLLHLPRAVTYGPRTARGCHRFVNNYGTALELRWRRLPEHKSGFAATTSAYSQVLYEHATSMWDIRVVRAALGAPARSGAWGASMDAVLGCWPDGAEYAEHYNGDGAGKQETQASQVEHAALEALYMGQPV